MTKKQITIISILIISAAMLVLPASAQTTSSTCISGTIEFPADLADKSLAVTDLTIYAINQKTGFGSHTNPEADGSFRIKVPTNGTYSIKVFPNQLTLESINSHVREVVYANNDDRKQLVVVPDSGVNNLKIEYYEKGMFISTTSTAKATLTVPAGMPTNPASATVEPAAQATQTPRPSPGFGLAAILVALGIVAFATRKN